MKEKSMEQGEGEVKKDGKCSETVSIPNMAVTECGFLNKDLKKARVGVLETAGGGGCGRRKCKGTKAQVGPGSSPDTEW